MKLFSFKKKKPSALKASEGKRLARETTDGSGFSGGKTKTERAEMERTDAKIVAPKAPKGSFSRADAIVRPRITEKATDVAAGANAYTFVVRTNATKPEIAAAVKALYGVEPVKINCVKIPKKRVRGRRGERGEKSGGKKAYVFLKKGDSLPSA